MAHVVIETCLDCKYTHCVSVCPTTAFREGTDMLYINPDECIDCGACVVECPVNAILPDYELNSEQQKWILINELESKKNPVIINNKKPLKGERCTG